MIESRTVIKVLEAIIQTFIIYSCRLNRYLFLYIIMMVIISTKEFFEGITEKHASIYVRTCTIIKPALK